MLPFAVPCNVLALLLSVAAFVTGPDVLAKPPDHSKQCTQQEGGQFKCNTDLDDETGSFIQLLIAVVPPDARPPQKNTSVQDEALAFPLVESEISMPSAVGQARIMDQAYLLSELELKPSYPPMRHPMWKPEWHRMVEKGALMAGLFLFIGGVICTAGGIGGGGIYVTVLMFFGDLSVFDAIPMSKIVVFAASLPSLILNLRKNIILGDSSQPAKSLIDYSICRVVVPWALMGTLCGVFLNRHLPGMVIVGVLCHILVFMTFMVCRTGYQQHCEEVLAEQKPWKLGTDSSSHSSPAGQVPAQQPPRERRSASFKASDVDHLPESTNRHPSRPSSRDELFPLDVKLAFTMLFAVIYFGTLRFHAAGCERDKGDFACHHPVAQIITFGQMQRLKDESILTKVGYGILLVPITYCFLIAAYYCRGCVQNEEGWNWCNVTSYSTMALITGCLAGLVGIGGGLIFAPFFIQMCVDPHVAVATSSTCVIFVAASTAFQYLLADRVIVSLILSFGIPHLMAAYIGTKLVHYIQDNYGTRKSFVTWIVAFGVATSTVLAIQKFFTGGECEESADW